MALRILILACSLVYPAAKPSSREAVPIGQCDRVSCESSGMSPADGRSSALAGPSCNSWPARGRFHSLAGCGEDLVYSPQSPTDDADDESEIDLQTPAIAIGQAGGIDLAFSLLVPARFSPLVAPFSSWRPPLRC
jgi:hypothetical protein